MVWLFGDQGQLRRSFGGDVPSGLDGFMTPYGLDGTLWDVCQCFIMSLYGTLSFLYNFILNV